MHVDIGCHDVWRVVGKRDVSEGCGKTTIDGRDEVIAVTKDKRVKENKTVELCKEQVFSKCET